MRYRNGFRQCSSPSNIALSRPGVLYVLAALRSIRAILLAGRALPPSCRSAVTVGLACVVKTNASCHFPGRAEVAVRKLFGVIIYIVFWVSSLRYRQPSTGQQAHYLPSSWR